MLKLFRNIAFIGGIHGVGKSTLCKTICIETGLTYLSASEVLKWKEISNSEIDKKVSDVNFTQDRLIQGLLQIINPQVSYLLDGHFCVLGSDNKIKKIPIEIFEQINPFSLNLIVEDVALIKARLETRDQRIYDADVLTEMQSNEIAHSNDIAEKFGIELAIGTTNDIAKFVRSIKQHIP